MTHKYLNQIRTIPNYHQDQSNLAKTMRGISHGFKSASKSLINNKKTRIITSVLAVYMVLTSGFVIAFLNVDNSQANAQTFVPNSNLEISIKKQKVEAGNITLKLEITNKTNEIITNPNFQFQSSFDNVTWTTSNDDSNNTRVDSQNSSFRLSNINPNQKVTYNVNGQLKNLNISSIVVTTKASYLAENKSQEINSPKFLIDLK
jgi:hypothetical protein